MVSSDYTGEGGTFGPLLKQARSNRLRADEEKRAKNFGKAAL